MHLLDQNKNLQNQKIQKTYLTNLWFYRGKIFFVFASVVHLKMNMSTQSKNAIFLSYNILQNAFLCWLSITSNMKNICQGIELLFHV